MDDDDDDNAGDKFTCDLDGNLVGDLVGDSFLGDDDDDDNDDADAVLLFSSVNEVLPASKQHNSFSTHNWSRRSNVESDIRRKPLLERCCCFRNTACLLVTKVW